MSGAADVTFFLQLQHLCVGHAHTHRLNAHRNAFSLVYAIAWPRVVLPKPHPRGSVGTPSASRSFGTNQAPWVPEALLSHETHDLQPGLLRLFVLIFSFELFFLKPKQHLL